MDSQISLQQPILDGGIRRGSDGKERWLEVHGRHFQQAGRRRFLAVLTVDGQVVAQQVVRADN